MKKISLLMLTVAFGTLLGAGAAKAGPYCREFTQVVKIGNTQQKSYGTACMQADGSWQIMPNNPVMAYAEPEPQPQPSQTTYIIEEPRPVYYYRPQPIVFDFMFGHPHHPHCEHPHWHENHWHDRW